MNARKAIEKIVGTLVRPFLFEKAMPFVLR
jgi:hypothetical protein